MKFTPFFQLLFFCALLSCLILSCEKKDRPTKVQLDNKLSYSGGNSIEDWQLSLVNAARNSFDRIPHATMNVQWDQAKVGFVSNWVIVPVDINGSRTDSGAVIRNLLLYKNSKGVEVGRIVDYLPTKRYSDNYGNLLNGELYDGVFLVYDLNETFLSGHIYEKGKKKYRAEIRSSATAALSDSRVHTYYASNTSILFDDCVQKTVCFKFVSGMGYYCIYAYLCEDTDSEVSDIDEPKPEWCEPDYGSIPGNPDNPGGGIPSSPVVPWQVPVPRLTEIRDSLKTPCFINALGMVNSPTAMNTISKTLNMLFGEGTRVDVTFNEKELEPGDYGETNGYMDVDENGKIKAHLTITLSTELKQSSMEYIVTVLLHETIHAYMFARGRDPIVEANDVQHQVMALQYRGNIEAALREIFPYFRGEEISLAWGGLRHTLSWQLLKTNEPGEADQIENNLLYFRAGEYGTKCQ